MTNRYAATYGTYGLFDLKEIGSFKHCPMCGSPIEAHYHGDYTYSLLCYTDDCEGIDFIYSDIYGSVVQTFYEADVRNIELVERTRRKQRNDEM